MNEHLDPRFDLTTPAHRLRTRGVLGQVEPEEWSGAAVAAAVEELLHREDLVTRAPDGTPTTPVVVGAVPFDPQAPARLWRPLVLERTEGPTAPEPETEQPSAELPVSGEDSPAYREAVAEAVRRIREGELEKVVLARRAVLTSERDLDAEAIRGDLHRRNPAAFTFRVDLPGGSEGEAPVLLGASPELVLSSEGREVRSHPLAGSAARVPEDPRADRAVAEALMGSEKNRVEHALVVRAVAEALRGCAEQVDAPDTPDLVQTPVLWHLGTLVQARLRPGVSPLEAVYAVHPTPAVCGWPTEVARGLIGELEEADRGFFSGLVGWIDAEGRSEWALALRCGLVEGARATLWAGAGIVGASDPEQEHQETGVKFRTFARSAGAGVVRG